MAVWVDWDPSPVVTDLGGGDVQISWTAPSGAHLATLNGAVGYFVELYSNSSSYDSFLGNNPPADPTCPGGTVAITSNGGYLDCVGLTAIFHSVPYGEDFNLYLNAEGAGAPYQNGNPGAGGFVVGSKDIGVISSTFVAQSEGICIAFNDPTLEPDPTWTRIDDGVTKVASYTIDRGRQFELDRTDGGRANITIYDTTGVLDPTNSAGTFYGRIEPLLQATIARRNPWTGLWQTRFRGFVSDYDYGYDQKENLNRLTLSLVDIFEIVNSVQMFPGVFGDTPPARSAGNVFFDNANVDDRINQVLTNAFGTTAAAAFSVVFSGNVSLYETVYSPGESAMTAIQEAADSEFPGVSNVYPDRFGRLCFHGRLAKFDPTGTATSAGTANWDFQHWRAGDRLAVGSSAGTAIASEFAFNRGLSKIINQALAYPVNGAGLSAASYGGSIQAQLVSGTASITQYGYRSWSRENLLTETGLLGGGSDAWTETKRFAQYYVDNYSSPRNRVTNLAFRPVAPASTGGSVQWKLLTQVDIADQIDITMRGAAGTVAGFNQEPYYVEGIHEEVVGRFGGTIDDVTLRLDVSPAAYFTSNPFPTS